MDTNVTVAWVFPRTARCGISFYARRYIDALKEHFTILELDSDDLQRTMKKVCTKAREADIVHLQYETSLYFRNGRDHYEEFARSVGRPTVVSLHEVYHSFPGVFPRDQIRGGPILRTLRRIIYDRRHPMVTAYRRHLRNNFLSRRLLVHSQFQHDILVESGVQSSLLRVLPHPIDKSPVQASKHRPMAPYHLVSSGFVNPNFDYDLLFAALSRLEVPWKFTWIGGPRREEDAFLQKSLGNRAEQHGWKDRFNFTGWVGDEVRDDLLAQSDVYCAFFKNRSSSSSLAIAMGAGCSIIANRGLLSDELAAASGALYLVDSTPEAAAQGILHLIEDSDERCRLSDSVDRYIDTVSFNKSAKAMQSIYEELC